MQPEEVAGHHHAHGLEPLPGQVHGRPFGRQPQGPQVVAHRVVQGRLGQGRGLGAHHNPGQPVRGPLRRRAGRPEQAAAGGRGGALLRIERTRSGQRLELRPRHPGPADQVLPPGPRPPGHDPLRRRLPHAAHRGQSQSQHRVRTAPIRPWPLQRGPHLRAVHVGPAYGDAVTAGIGHQGLGGPEPHGLGVEEAGGERRRVVQLEPAARVDKIRERHRVRLGKAEVGEGGQARRRPGRPPRPSRRVRPCPCRAGPASSPYGRPTAWPPWPGAARRPRPR